MIFSSFRHDPFVIGHSRFENDRLARGREDDGERLTVGAVAGASALAVLVSGLALALAVAWLGIVDHAALAALLVAP